MPTKPANTPPTVDPRILEAGEPRTIRLSAPQQRTLDKTVQRALREGLKVPGPVRAVRCKESHVLRIAIELGLPHVLDALRALNAAAESED